MSTKSGKIWLCILTELSPGEYLGAGQRDCSSYERGMSGLWRNWATSGGKSNIYVTYCEDLLNFNKFLTFKAIDKIVKWCVFL